MYELSIKEMLFTHVNLLWVLCWVNTPTWKLALVSLEAWDPRYFSEIEAPARWHPELGDCPHLKADSFITSLFIVWIYTWGEEGYISEWDHCKESFAFYFVGWEIHPLQLLQAGQQLNEPWGQCSSQLAAWLGLAASESTGAGLTMLSLTRGLGASCAGWSLQKLWTALLLSFHWRDWRCWRCHHTQQSRHWNTDTGKDRVLLLPSSKELVFGETIHLQNNLHLKFYPQWVFLIFVHRLHVDNTSLLVTHHTTRRGVRHSGDYLVDNLLFLLETFQGWSNSNHTEKKSNKQYSIMATDYILFKKTLRVLLYLFFFFLTWTYIFSQSLSFLQHQLSKIILLGFMYKAK